MYFIISEYIYMNDKEQIASGDMSIIRSNIISNETFGIFAKKIHLDKHIKISKGQSKIGISDLMLSNCFEALIGAIYLDSGIASVKKFIFDNFKLEIHDLFAKRPIKNEKMLANESKQKD